MPLRQQIEDELITLRQDRVIFRLRHEFAGLRLQLSASEDAAKAAEDFGRAANDDLARVNRLISTAEARLQLHILPPDESGF